MKRLLLPLVAAAGLMPLVAAQAQAVISDSAPPNGVRTAPVTLPAPAQPMPAPIIIHSKEYIGSHEPSPQDPQAARQEAGAALAVSRERCREERAATQRKACLRQAQERYRAALQGLPQ